MNAESEKETTGSGPSIPVVVSRALTQIANSGGADFLFHLAGFYDFENLNDPEYENTNVRGTRLVPLLPTGCLFAQVVE